MDDVPYRLYRFRSTKTRRFYMVRVEMYPNHFYGIKFYLKSDARSDKKYTRLTGLHEVRPVINTCINILLEISKEDARSSFGFIGAQMKNETGVSKRFRIYSIITSTYFSETDFYHYTIEEKNAYALIRRSEICKNPNLVYEVSAYFSEHYTDFD